MIFGEGLGGLILLALWIFCFIDVLTTPEASCRNLPKLAWIFIVLLLSVIGSIIWLIAGHDWDRTLVKAGAPPRAAGGSRGKGSSFPSNPDDDEEFLAGLSKRAEEQRRRATEQPRDQSDDDA